MDTLKKPWDAAPMPNDPCGRADMGMFSTFLIPAGVLVGMLSLVAGESHTAIL
jgi:hypothetical protein